jgi:DNA (cytosine-5)-methyltransferase 1
MAGIGSRDTGPERIFRKALRRLGVRSFKLCQDTLTGKPDIVLPRRKVAIFIDGDFWHGHQYRTRGFGSLDEQFAGVHNAAYWPAKISRNIERDFRNTSALLKKGWRVLRFWERDVRSDPEKCARIALQARKAFDCAAFSALPERTTVELFAGIGLVRLALRQAGWETVFANDNDPQKFQMYKDNFPQNGFDSRDVHDIPAKSIPTSALITASFPCNDLSVAGARRGLAGQQSSAFWGLIRILHQLRNRRPPIVLLENVVGFLTSHGGRDFQTALQALNELGYCCDAFVLDASWFVPQSRVRLFVVGKLGIEQPNPTPPHISRFRPKALVDFITEHQNVQWDIQSLPEIRIVRASLESILEDLPESDPRWWNFDRAAYFMNQLSPRHLRIARFMISQPKVSYGTAFRRIRKGRSMAELRVDGLAGCLRTPRGGSGRQILFKAGKGRYQVRLLTPRECARLQGVPDEAYQITVRDNQALFGFGDAICVPVIKWIADNYLTPTASELMRGRALPPLVPSSESKTC